MAKTIKELKENITKEILEFAKENELNTLSINVSIEKKINATTDAVLESFYVGDIELKMYEKGL